MTDRIRQLEDALALLQASISKDPHPLLCENAIIVDAEDAGEKFQESEGDGTGEVSTALGTLSVSDHGFSRFFGSTGGSDLLLVCLSLEGFFGQFFDVYFSLTTKIPLGHLVKKQRRVTAQGGLTYHLNFSDFPMLSHSRPWDLSKTSSSSSGAICLRGNMLPRWLTPTWNVLHGYFVA
jgi:hypothetical protein